jgi:hypothetical protein
LAALTVSSTAHGTADIGCGRHELFALMDSIPAWIGRGPSSGQRS